VLRRLAGVWYNLVCQGDRNNMATHYRSDAVEAGLPRHATA
jgi:hypothetical protein